MPPPLTEAAMQRLVGEQSLARGRRYAEDGRVTEVAWHESARCLNGVVQGNRAQPYRVTIVFAPGSGPQPRVLASSCTCPMIGDCKHVAAVLIASADQRARHGQPAKRPDWRAALAPLTAQARQAAADAMPLALQFTLLAAPPRSRYAPAATMPARPRLGVRPMVPGKQGRWVHSYASWSTIAYARSDFDPRHLRVAKELKALHAADEAFARYDPQWLQLDGITSAALWSVLAAARDEGMPLILDNRQQTPVRLAEQPAVADLDVSRSADGLAIAPIVMLDDVVLAPATMGFVGRPAHGIFAWEPVEGSLKPAGLTLAALAEPVSSEVCELVLSDREIVVPAGDEADFMSEVLPLLASSLHLSSRDGTFAVPELPHPVLEAAVTHHGRRGIEIAWGWRYPGPDDDVLDARRVPLWPLAADAGYRDPIAEARALDDIRWLLDEHPALAHEHRGHRRLGVGAVLSGRDMLRFLQDAVPRLAEQGVVVTELGQAPQYREAEAPTIEVAARPNPTGRDWFDLDVIVRIEDTQVPFDELFRALAEDQEVLILDSGAYFSLDRPELQHLRRLIEEARALQDPGSNAMRLSRYQVDLWQELVDLGVVADQADAWRQAVGALGSDAAPPERREVPAAVHATLRTYQQDGFDWLLWLREHGLGGILADDMGLGKTLQAIALIAAAREPGADPFLVVAPASVVHNWARECEKFAPSLDLRVLRETAAKRGGALAEHVRGADVVITSYTIFRLDAEAFAAESWAGLLLDEAQFVKNPQSRAHLAARRLPAPFKLAMTGTPLENNLMELWSLLSITAPGLFPSPTRFAEYYQRPIERLQDADRLGQLRRRIRPFMLRRSKEDVASDLPPKQEQVMELELHPRHRRVYETHLQRERQKVLGLLQDMQANRFEVFRSLTMLRLLSLDAGLVDAKYDAIPSAKLDALMELLDDVVAEGHRVLVFSQFTSYLAKARARLDGAGFSYAYLDGRTRNRADAIESFTSGAAPVFLISLKAGGFGLNLTEADYVVLLDPWWNPATEAQAIDRAHRIGQDKHVIVYRFVSKDTIEEKVMALKATKAALFDSVMSGGAAKAAGLTATEIRELLS